MMYEDFQLIINNLHGALSDRKSNEVSRHTKVAARRFATQLFTSERSDLPSLRKTARSFSSIFQDTKVFGSETEKAVWATLADMASFVSTKPQIGDVRRLLNRNGAKAKVLRLVAKKPGITVREAADQLDMSVTHFSNTLRDLESTGYISALRVGRTKQLELAQWLLDYTSSESIELTDEADCDGATAPNRKVLEKPLESLDSATPLQFLNPTQVLGKSNDTQQWWTYFDSAKKFHEAIEEADLKTMHMVDGFLNINDEKVTSDLPSWCSEPQGKLAFEGAKHTLTLYSN